MMKRLYFKKTFVFGLILVMVCGITVIGCQDDDGILEKNYETQFYRESQLTNIYNNEIVDHTSDFVSKTANLQSTIEQFRQNPSATNLLLAQNDWETMLLTWKELELYKIGDVSDSFLFFDINLWPSNETLIDTYINGTDTIDETFISSHGASSKGISALEFLLFSSENPSEVLNSFTTDMNANRRLDYLVALATNLNTKAQALQTVWQNYQPEFISSLQNGINGSQNLVINAMVTLTEQIVIRKLGNPLGDNTGGILNPESLEASRSGNSLTIIERHLKSLQRCYSGDFKQTPFRIGFDDYLVKLGYEELSVRIHEQFNICQQQIETINGTLYEELTNNPQNVVALQDTFRDLLVLLKVDMANAIGSTITFNDNDGD